MGNPATNPTPNYTASIGTPPALASITAASRAACSFASRVILGFIEALNLKFRAITTQEFLKNVEVRNK